MLKSGIRPVSGKAKSVPWVTQWRTYLVAGANYVAQLRAGLATKRRKRRQVLVLPANSAIIPKPAFKLCAELDDLSQ
jgi:hypothetical protein